MFTLVVLTLGAALVFSGYQIGKSSLDYENEAEVHDKLLEYKPKPTDKAEEIVNQSVVDLKERYPDTAGWITIPNTAVDYPFVWYRDNDYYLRRDLDGKYLFAGTLFMDYRCEKDFTSENTIIYGHHMKNESMFGPLRHFNNKEFFQANPQAIIYLPNNTLTLEFFAYMVINPDTELEIYNINRSENYLDYVKKKARHYRNVKLEREDKVVTLSSCAYEFENARMVLLAKVS